MTVGQFEEADPIRELHGHIDQTVRVAMAAALQIGANHAEAETARLGDIRLTEQAARELKRRHEAQRSVAMAQWRQTQSSRWWREAGPAHVASTYGSAALFAEEGDAAAGDAFLRITDEVAGRYGVGIDPETVSVASTNGEDLDLHAVKETMPAVEAAVEQLTARTTGWRQALGPDLADTVMASDGWPGLEARLRELDRGGVDSATALREAVTSRDLGGARDPGRVLRFRISPPAHKAKDGGLGVEKEGLEQARLVNDTVSAAKGSEAPDGRASEHARHPEGAQAARRRQTEAARDPSPER